MRFDRAEQPVGEGIPGRVASGQCCRLGRGTLVIGGRRDRVGPFDQSRLLAGLIPGSRLVPLDTPNHLLPERDPAWPKFLAELDAFLTPPQHPR